MGGSPNSPIDPNVSLTKGMWCLIFVQLELQGKPRRSRGVLGPSLAENPRSIDPNISGQTTLRVPISLDAVCRARLDPLPRLYWTPLKLAKEILRGSWRADASQTPRFILRAVPRSRQARRCSVTISPQASLLILSPSSTCVANAEQHGRNGSVP